MGKPDLAIRIIDEYVVECNSLRVSLKNEAYSTQEALEGIYKLSSKNTTEGPNWIKNTKAIWAYPKKNIWYIGSMKNIGKDSGGIYARRIKEKGPDYDNLNWYYRSKRWKSDDKKDISIKCLDVQKNKP